ncbi:MAG: helix-turn-helix domain-containing protein [Levilactobacillus brevis]
MEIGRQIKKQREKYDWTQEQLAEKLNISRESISKWESGKSYPSIHNVIVLSDIFSLSLDTLLKQDHDLLTDYDKRYKKSVLNYIGSWIVVVTLSLCVLAAIFHMDGSNLILTTNAPAFIIFLWMLKTISWQKLGYVPTKKTIALFILFCVLLIFPSLYDGIISFLQGVVLGLRDSQ